VAFYTEFLKFTGGGHCRWCWSGAMLVMWEGQIGRATRLWQ
jgi:hypothetical protein